MGTSIFLLTDVSNVIIIFSLIFLMCFYSIFPLVRFGLKIRIKRVVYKLNNKHSNINTSSLFNLYLLLLKQKSLFARSLACSIRDLAWFFFYQKKLNYRI